MKRLENLSVKELEALKNQIEELEAYRRAEETLARDKAYEIIYEMQCLVENFKFDRIAKNCIYDAIYKMQEACENI